MFFAPPVFKGDEEKTRTAGLINTILVALTGVLVLALIGVVAGSRLISTIIALIVVLGLLLALQIPLRRGYVKPVALSIVILLTTLVTFTFGSGGTVRAPAVVALTLASIIAGLTISRRAAYWSTGINILIFSGLAYAEIHGFLPPVSQQTSIQQPIVFGALSVMTVVLVNQALRSIQAGLDFAKQSQEELAKLNVGLEQRVAERTKALETSAEISRRLASILDPRELASEVVNQIQTAFNYYYAQIYLFDEAGENLVLTAGTGEAGQEMMKRGHALPKGRGLVGRAAETKKPVLVSDTAQDPNWLPNDLLPDTKGEAAIPIISGDKVLGVLDVQDDVTNDINSGDITLLESLAGQVAISLQNARQYLESTRFKLGIENSGDAIFATDTEGTITYANASFEKVYGYSPAEVIGKNPRIFKSGLLSSENYEAFWAGLLSKQSVTGDIVNKHKDGHLVYIAGTNSAIVTDAGEIIGFLAVHHDITEQKSNQDLIAQRAHQQEAINTIAQRIQSATTIEEAMQVAARELGHALGNRQTLVALEPETLAETKK
ncbi:MAG: PAS domain S-box protein [Chloroflexota bacterium]